MENIKFFEAINTSIGLLRYIETLWKLIQVRIKYNPDIYILGFRGHEIFWLVRAITSGKVLVFDHMMSPYDSLINERKTIKSGGALAKFVFIYEKNILHNADIILTDTEIHKDFFSELFHIKTEKILAIPVGTDESLFYQKHDVQTSSQAISFEVLFYGTFLPLHGIDVIVKAAAKVSHLPIHFTLIGGGHGNQYAQLIREQSFGNMTHIEWVDFEKIPELVASADIGLGGPFGDTGQARRVITGKTMQLLAMAKPVIIGEIPPVYGFVDKFNCLTVPQGDDDALARSIIWAFEHQDLLKQIGVNGSVLYKEKFSVEQIAKKLEGIFES